MKKIGKTIGDAQKRLKVAEADLKRARAAYVKWLSREVKSISREDLDLVRRHAWAVRMKFARKGKTR